MLGQLHHGANLRARLRFQGKLSERLTRGVIGYKLGFLEQGFNRSFGPPHDVAAVISPPKYTVPNKPRLQRVNVTDILSMSADETVGVPQFGPLFGSGRGPTWQGRRGMPADARSAKA